jgi:hypothetical protein
MVEMCSTDFPAFLDQEFDKMIIPGGKRGFAISFASENGKQCVACGIVGDANVIIKYTGDAYSLQHRRAISSETFEKLCRSIPSEVKKSGFIFAEDILDGETYLVKWSWDNETTRLVLANPRQIDEQFGQIARRLDDLLCKA